MGQVEAILASLQSDLVQLLELRREVLELQLLRQRVRFVGPKILLVDFLTLKKLVMVLDTR